MEENNISSTLDDSWDDIDLSDVSDDIESDTELDTTDNTEDAASDDESNADQQQTESETPTEQTEVEAPKPDTDQFTLKHLDDTKVVGREEVIALAQKGLDYDRIRGKLDEKNTQESAALAFLTELANEQNTTVEGFIDNAKATMLAKKEGIEFSTALQRIKLDRDRAAFEAEKKQREEREAADNAKNSADEAKKKFINDDIIAFKKAFPGTDMKSVPESVWLDMSKGMSLVNAYAKYDLAKQKAEFAAQQKEDDNKKKSAGSVDSSGKSDHDWFDDLWDDGT